MTTMKLKIGREKSLLRKHLWIFSGAVDSLDGDPAPGEIVRVTDAKGNFLAWAACSKESQIEGRIWSFDEKETVDQAFFSKRIAAAAALRRTLGLLDEEGGCRLVNAEGDGLPGVVVDRYGQWLVMQLSSAGADRFRQEIITALQENCPCQGIFERSDAPVRLKEGLTNRCGVAAGAQPPNPIVIRENDVLYAVDVRHGQKTGFYFDQREARSYVARFAKGKRLLNLFSYTGGFAVAALKAGASYAVNVDSSAPALALAAHNMERNHIPQERFENREGDVFTVLRELGEAGEKFDLVVLDPPKFIESKHALIAGCRAYQDAARCAFKVLAPGGMLFTFSCSGLMTPELFAKITADAALEAGVDAAIIHRFEQAADHPTALAVPEGFYLNGLAVAARAK